MTDLRVKSKAQVLLDEQDQQIKNILETIPKTLLPIGSQIGKYTIIEEIDRGGMSVVYKALQADLKRIIALKVLPANITINQSVVSRFLTEAHSVAKLSHPNIVNIHEVGVQDGVYFIAMDYISGKNLFHFLNQKKPKVVIVLDIIKQLAQALSYAHEQKILHRDLKLNNVIMKDDSIPILIDFGLAKALDTEDSTLTKSGEIIGSPAYMAPERVTGQAIDGRSDICSLGIMLYEMLTFKNPYLDPRSIVQTTKNVLEANPVAPRKLVSWLPCEVEAITLKAMSQKPEERYQNMLELAKDIERYQRGDIVEARSPSIINYFMHFTRKHWASLSVISVIFCAMSIISYIKLEQKNKESAHWQLMVNEPFQDQKALDSWVSQEFIQNKPDTCWKIDQGRLVVTSNNPTFLRLERSVGRSVRIEFDVIAQNKDFFNVGFFIHGARPYEGYCIVLQRLNDGLCGISLPYCPFLFYNYEELKFKYNTYKHVVIEQRDNGIVLFVNGLMITKLNDCYPLIDKKSNNIGFFVDGCDVAFDNLKIYRQAIPQLAPPTAIADRYWAQGDFSEALQEYQDVFVDMSNTNLTRQVKFRIVDCMVRLDQNESALHLLSEIERESKQTDLELSQVYFYQILISRKTSNTTLFLNTCIQLSSQFQSSEANQSIAAYQIKECASLIYSGLLDSANEKLSNFVPLYPSQKIHFARLYLDLLKAYNAECKRKKVVQLLTTINELYSKDEEILTQTALYNAQQLLVENQRQKAIDLLNKALLQTYSSAAQWRIWMLLSEIYCLNHRYTEALSVLKRVISQCPKNSNNYWAALLKAGELIARNGNHEKSIEYFHEVFNGNHPFVEQRLVAGFYIGTLEENVFTTKWNLIMGVDGKNNYYIAQKYLIEGRLEKAEHTLKLYRKVLSAETWEHMFVTNLIEEIHARMNYAH